MRRLLPLAVTFLLTAVPARAELIVLGNTGMVYDTVQDLTWLQDMAYVSTSGHDADGRLTYVQAYDWADSLVFGGYNDWRLPEMRTLDLGYWSDDEITDLMAQLGGYFESPFTYHYPTSWGPFLPPALPLDYALPIWIAPPPGVNTCPEPSNIGCYAWMGWTTIDHAEYHWRDGNRPGATALAVREGIARVPEPSTLLLLGLGMIGLCRGRRHH